MDGGLHLPLGVFETEGWDAVSMVVFVVHLKGGKVIYFDGNPLPPKIEHIFLWWFCRKLH